jgi:energy-converting hydrogenase Eha subunit E
MRKILATIGAALAIVGAIGASAGPASANELVADTDSNQQSNTGEQSEFFVWR